MARHHLPDVWLEESQEIVNGVPGRKFGITIEPNQDASCFSIRQTHADPADEDLIHFCDWPALRKAVDEFMAERERIAREDGDWHG